MGVIYIYPTVLLACSGSAEKEDANSAPVIQSLSITGDTFSTSDTLTCAVQYIDERMMSYQHLANGPTQNGDSIGFNVTITTLQVGSRTPRNDSIVWSHSTMEPRL